MHDPERSLMVRGRKLREKIPETKNGRKQKILCRWACMGLVLCLLCGCEMTGSSLMAGIRVAVIDSGLNEEDSMHADGGWNYLLQSEDTTDDVGHGTKIAELICMYAPSAVVVPLKVSGKDADTEPETVIQSIYDAIDNYDCQVICMAFSIPDSEDLQAVVAYAKRHQVILISAVGNLGETYKKDKLLYPAAYDSVIGVGAVDAQGTVATYSQKNDSVFVTAEETALDGESRGTSFAAARIAAICARRSWSTPEDFRQYLMEEAEDAGDPGYDTSYGWGICTP